MFCLNKWQYYFVNVFQHFVFIRPMILSKCHVPVMYLGRQILTNMQEFCPGKLLGMVRRYRRYVVAQITTVIWRLSSKLVHSTHFVPFSFIFQWEPGTMFTPVWSQIIMRSIGRSSVSTAALISKSTVSLTPQNKKAPPLQL